MLLLAIGGVVSIARSEALSVRGAVSGVWGTPADTVVIDSFAWVPAAETLWISPGMVVAFSGRFSLVINGTLLAIGENDDSIRVHRLPYHASDGHLGLRFRNTTTVSRLNKVVFEDGFANSGNEERYGGALELYFAEVEMDSCSFFGNRARIDGGAIYSREAGTLTIRDCEFIGDSTRFGAGGAVLARTSGTVTIERCRFVDNKAITSGGAVVTESGVTPRISECYFADNFAFQRGGALWLRSVPAAGYVRGSVIESSTADQGGGIYLDNARGVIESCSIRTCTARVGGGIAARGTNNTTTISRTVITGNAATEDGGGLYFVESARSITANSVVSGNSAVRGGGAFCASGTAPEFRFETISGNFADEGSALHFAGAGRVISSIITGGDSLIHFAQFAVPQLSFTNVYAVGGLELTGFVPDGLLDDSRLNVALVPCDSLRNIRQDPDFADAGAGDFRLTNESPCLFGADTSFAGGLDFAGAARISPDGSWPDMGAFESDAVLPHGEHCGPQWGVWYPGDYIIGCTLRVEPGDTLVLMGGSRLLFAPGAGLEIEGTLLAFGTARDSILFDRYFELPGSTWEGVRIAGSTVSHLDYCTIQGVAGEPALEISTGGAAIENCRFTNNTNPDGCGGAICSRTLMAVTLEECRFDENTAKHGGAVCISGGSGRIAKCEFAGNSAVAESDDQESLGGALHCTGGTIIDRCSFTRNQAEGGGAVYSECGIISNSSFDSCSAVIGGAILQRNSPAVFEQLEFRFNRASEGSGAVYIDGTECSDFGSVYRGNSSFFGGAIGVDSGVYSGDSILCLDNGADAGGGVLWIGGSGFAQLSNSELYRNHAEDGGAVYADGGGIDFEYCLLDSNNATRVGGGVYLAGSGMIARKCTFVNNTAPPLGGLIHARGNAFVTANSTLFAGNEDFVLVPSDETSLEFTFCLSDGSFGSAVDSMGMPQRVNFNGDSCDFGFNLIGEPEFVDFAARDYRLLENSLAVHAGDSMLPNDRDGTRSDIGLYPGERPYALPRPFNLTTPLQAQRIHTRDVVEFAWNESRDDDPGDRVTYQLRLVGESIDMTFDTQEERTLPMNIEAGEYTWWVVASSLRPDTSRVSFEVRQLVVYDSIAAATESGLPMVFGVELNGPNPFNSTTQLRLALPRPARVVVEVHDVLGRQATHGEYEFSAGVHYVGIDGSHWGSGVYWATVTTAENRSRVKLLLVK